jgi:hypothetical protein
VNNFVRRLPIALSRPKETAIIITVISDGITRVRGRISVINRFRYPEFRLKQA